VFLLLRKSQEFFIVLIFLDGLALHHGTHRLQRTFSTRASPLVSARWKTPNPAEDLGSSRTWASHFGGSGGLGGTTGFS
jgi:hypothetical protein